MNKIEEILKAWNISFSPNEAQAQLAAERLTVCDLCEFKVTNLGLKRCKVCGCALKGKVFSPVKGACPKGKWDDIDDKYNFKEARKFNTGGYTLNLDWTYEWKEILQEIPSVSEISFILLTIVDNRGTMLTTRRLTSIPVLNGEITKAVVKVESNIKPVTAVLSIYDRRKKEVTRKYLDIKI
jgi:rubredoxin